MHVLPFHSVVTVEKNVCSSQTIPQQLTTDALLSAETLAEKHEKPSMCLNLQKKGILESASENFIDLS